MYMYRGVPPLPLVSLTPYSVSPRMNERGGGGGFSAGTEREIVSGGMVHVHAYSIHSLDALRLILRNST